MSVVVSNNFVVAEANLGGGVIINENNPVILWNNQLTRSTIAATTAETAYPATNLANNATNFRWQATSAALNYLTFTPGSAEQSDAVGLARHNFGSQAIAVSLEADDGGGFDEIIAPFIPGNDRPILMRYTAASYQAVRVKLAAGDAAPQLAVMFVGKTLVMQRRIYVPHTPMPMGRVVAVTNNMSDSGEFLGRIVKSKHRTTGHTFMNLKPDWYRTYVDPFVEYALEADQGGAFFFAWRPGSYPDEVGYGYLTNQPRPQNQNSAGMVKVDFQIGGVA